jgi:hypothetical protein
MQATFSTTLTCGGCLQKVTPLLDSEPTINKWEADLNDPRKLLKFDLNAQGRPDAIAELISRAGFGAILIDEVPKFSQVSEKAEPSNSFKIATYLPLFLVVSYVIGLAAFAQFQQPAWDWNGFMTYFMGFFFLGFAFFKLLNVAKFADAFSTYDIVAKRSRGYGLMYPWIEVGLGLLFITGTWLVAANIATAIVMSIGLVGVVAAVRKKQAIQCACLGTAFNLPMSVVTIIENSVMIVMALVMLMI